jgi:hypothetical protein
MTVQHIGQDFSTSVKLNILPGLKLKRGIYQTNIQYVTDTGGLITIHHMTQNMHSGIGEEMFYVFGRDVREITFQIYCHNSYPTNPLVNYRYTMRLDRLILLNLAARLLKFS